MFRILRWVGIGLGALLLLGLLWYTFIFDWNDLKDHLTTAVGERTHREFSVGDLDVDLSWTPRIRLDRVRLENARWSEDAQMAEIESLEFTLRLLPLLRGRVVLPELSLIRPRMVLERNTDGSPNWDFAATPAGEVAIEAAVPEDRGEFPVIGRLLITDGVIVYRDAPRNISIESKVTTAVGLSAPGREQVRVDGRGRFEGMPFSLSFIGGSLLALREDDDPYPLETDVRIGDTHIQVQGTALDPIRGEGLKLTLALEGRDLSEVFPIFGIPLPASRPYHVTGALFRDEGKWQFQDFSGAIGESDLAGTLMIDFAPHVPYMNAQFVSTQLQLSELAGFFGVRPEPEERDKDRVIPDTPIDLTRLRAMNMDVEFRAERVVAAKVPAQRVHYRLRLRDGRLLFSPLEFDVAQGTITGDVQLDGTTEQPRLAVDLTMRHLQLGRLLPKLEAAGVAYGTFGGRLRVDGSGESLRQILSRSDGGFWLSMSGGAVDELVLAAAGVAVPDLLRLMGAEKTPVPLRCSVVSFDLEDGLLTSDVIVIDAEKSTLFGEGTINLKDERIDLTLDGQSKEPSALTLGGTIDIEGTLRRPTVGLDLSGAAAQAGVAAALSAILAPLAAILPFVDPGAGEDTECRELFAMAGRSVEETDSKTP